VHLQVAHAAAVLQVDQAQRVQFGATQAVVQQRG
jgi:hypothetical protein